MKKILFVCVHNSARSQMAETFLNDIGKGEFVGESAGLEPGSLNPLAVKAMQEIGYDMSENNTNSVFDFYKEGRKYNHVVKVCDQISGQKCPIFPGVRNMVNWNIEDPSSVDGSDEEKMERVREIRDQIQNKVINFIEEYKS